MKFNERLLAITDIETTGDIFSVHEILEIGLVLCDPKTFEIVDTLNIKVKPQHIENAIPKALERNGYNEKDWKEAGSLKEAMEIYGKKVSGSVLYAYNASFDWGFINYALEKTGVKNEMDYHLFDIMSMAFQKLNRNLESVSLNYVSKILGLEEEKMPHNALNGAIQAYEVLRKI